FGPDPIEYRAERGLIDFGEEMGIMIQEVVGTRVGDYFMPAFAGVAFSRNEFRWSPRISRDDGLVRLVPGLGTRAVDRLSDDYPVMCAPGQPGLRVNVSVDDVLRYTPKKIDVINLTKNSFETIEVNELLKNFGYDMPMIKRLVSIHKAGYISKPVGSHIDFDEDDLVVTFDGLISDTPFIKQIHDMLKLLEETIGHPVDIEFAHDGKDLYLLQCRAQSPSDGSVAAPIPKDIPDDRMVFSANRYISNGRVPDITHIVYVDPDKYSELAERDDLIAVGRAIGKLNKLLPKRRFILIGPGRWGSRGDIRLGVKVTYSDINNTAVLAEVARKKGNYTPDLSFGTHFFQDLVEARIRYLPLFPDDKGVAFNEKFLTRSPNILCEITPEFASLQDTIRLIDVSAVTNGKVLRVLMNADLDEAVGILSSPSDETTKGTASQMFAEHASDSSWRWRFQMAEHIAATLDPDRFGVKALYVFGSTKNASAGAASDIDLLVHFDGTPKQREMLEQWFDGWSLALGEINYLKTGYKSGGLLDVHIVTDKDIEQKTSYAVKIGAVTDPARALPLHKKK
ncbi:MAG: pyruvate, phosphate dikinase, partial [Candidatus Zixiibacteriota bacterium]